MRRLRCHRRAAQAWVITLALGFILLSISPDLLQAVELQEGFTETLIIDGLMSPTAMQFAPDGRLFVAEQNGNLRVIENNVLLPTPFLSVNVSTAGESGLLGVAFDPNFDFNHNVYVYYTSTDGDIHNRLSRFIADGNLALPNSEQILIEFDPLNGATDHNGGALHFGPGGKLYVAVGESTYPPNAQANYNLAGKILRINPDGTIPEDNPFYNEFPERGRAIWAMGLRNPFTFAFQPGTGRLFINDVGANEWEEINEGFPGANYGWPETEGPHDHPEYENPLFAYSHNGEEISGCAITGGAFYNPETPQFPELSFQWQRNGVDIPGATEPTYTGLAAVDDNGARLSCKVSNALGSASSAEAVLSVINGQKPVGTIIEPPETLIYKGGDVITYSATATDAEDGELPPDAFTWEIVFHHDDHTHPFMLPYCLPDQAYLCPRGWMSRLCVTPLFPLSIG